MREGLRSLSRPFWLALVVAAFCAPLFIGLGRTDVDNDEGIYSFAVDGILAHGDWLNPRSSPNDDVTFVEKPPLKFWIVAAPIRLGLLPHNEFGLRFWDVLFGGVAFLYVFSIGRRLAGPVCGLVAMMVLFSYEPLLFLHGLRNNNMEAPLFLSYCGGVYHYLRWMADDVTPRRRWHLAAVWAYFFLGFMTKFVAVLFLPLVLATVAAFDRAVARKFWQDRGAWSLGLLVCLALAAPWFIYQSVQSGWAFWGVIFSAHVYLRFTGYLDLSHVHPWSFYLTTMVHELDHFGTLGLVIAGSILLIVHTVRQRRSDGLLVISWFVAPVSLMSCGTSKLHHYLYPFLPPVAIAAGYGPAWLLGAGRSYVDKAMDWVQERVGSPKWSGGLRTALLVVAAAATLLSIVTLVLGGVDWRIGGTHVFRNSHVGRPLVIAFLLATIAGRAVLAGRWLLPVAVLMSILPITAYENVLHRLPVEQHPLRSTRDCLRDVRQRELDEGRPAPGMYAIEELQWFLHSYYYYFHHVGGWERSEQLDRVRLKDALATPGHQRPVILPEKAYVPLRDSDPVVREAPRSVLGPNAVLLMPGPYAGCAPKPAPLPH